MPHFPDEIEYSEKYKDEKYEYRHVILPKPIFKTLTKGKMLTEPEWRDLGVQQSRGWVHYDFHRPEPHILLFRSRDEKRILINDVKRSPSENNGNSSFKTILSLANLNFGFTLLIFGLQNKLNGFIFGLAALGLALGITLKTSFLQLIHCKNQELDFPEVVERVMGGLAKKIYILSSCFYIALNQMINFIYATDMFYWLISFISKEAGTILPGKTDFTFNQFSFQYAGIIMFVIYNLGFLVKKMSILSSLGPIGILAVIIVVLFSIVHGIMNISNANLIFHAEFSLQDFAILMAALSMGFFGHLWHLPILKNNLNQENNKRDLSLSFYLTAFLFYVDGLFGSMAISDQTITDEVSILDFFKDSWIIFFIRCMVFIQITTSSILATYLMKGKLWNVFPEDKIITKTMEISVNLFVSACWLLIQIFNVDITILIGLTGALGAFLGIYLFPIWIHLKCLYSSGSNIVDNNGIFSVHSHETNGLKAKLISESDLGHNLGENVKHERKESLFEALASNRITSCSSNHEKYMATPKYLRISFYTFIFLIGVSLIGIRVYALIN